MNTIDKKKWDKIIKNHIPCTCGEIYLSRNLTAPDCPYHANDWESPMVEFLKELKEQQAEQIRLYEKTLDITTDQLMEVQAERNELKEETNGLRWVKCGELPNPPVNQGVLAFHSTSRNTRTNSVNPNGEWNVSVNGRRDDVTHWMPLPTAPSGEAAQKIKP